ncbi:nucleotide-binding oligomerization domain-containing protein 2-like [Sycon ciliatum]|uniref:nucleotide-binding oligomerization domain-containing protein 2-like n=1 Tax=Sycon ciliatum TaxID=27933 RepID=UPI0031F6A70A
MPLLAMVAGLSLLIIAVISVYYIRSADYGFSSSVDRAQRLLRIRYGKANEIYSPMFEASTASTVDNIYINLVKLPKGDLSDEFKHEFQSSSDDMWRIEHAFTSAGQRMQSLNLESLLNNTHQDQSSHLTGQTLGTIVMASAGCGKSFVFTRVAPIKWAAGELWPNKKLLVARELRFPDVHKATSLSKLLGLDGIGIEDSYGQQEICDHVREHPESLVLILDGLDEVNLKDMSSFVYDVLFGKELQGIHLIVTSRPCADIFQLSVLPHFHQHIELLGFKQDDVERYISSVLSPEKAETLIAEVNRSAYLGGMMATPFMAQEVCVQYHFGLDAPQCMTDMFEQMIIQIINRKYSRSYKQWNEVPVEAQLLVMEIGQFAFNMLAEKRMIFNDADLQKQSLTERALKLGLLVSGEECLSRNVVKQHRFSHLTTQEYLAAIYLARHPTRNMMNSFRIIQLVEILGAETAHLRTFWTMLCAQLSTAQAECLVNSLLTRERVTDWVEGKVVRRLHRNTSRVHSGHFAQSRNISAYFKRSDEQRRNLQSLAFHSFAELAMQQKRACSSLPSIRTLLAFRQDVRISTGHHPAEMRSIDIVLRHHPP